MLCTHYKPIIWSAYLPSLKTHKLPLSVLIVAFKGPSNRTTCRIRQHGVCGAMGDAFLCTTENSAAAQWPRFRQVPPPQHTSGASCPSFPGLMAHPGHGRCFARKSEHGTKTRQGAAAEPEPPTGTQPPGKSHPSDHAGTFPPACSITVCEGGTGPAPAHAARRMLLRCVGPA